MRLFRHKNRKRIGHHGRVVRRDKYSAQKYRGQKRDYDIISYRRRAVLMSPFLFKRSLLLSKILSSSRHVPRETFAAVMDRRRFSPVPVMPSRTISGAVATVANVDRRSLVKGVPSSVIAYVNPKRVITCVRRKERRRELFKRGKIGFGRRVNSIHRWNDDSYIKC